MTTNNYQEPIPLQLCTYSLSEKMLIRSTADSKTKEKKRVFVRLAFWLLIYTCLTLMCCGIGLGRGCTSHRNLSCQSFCPVCALVKRVEEYNITYTYISVNIDYLFSTVQLLANIIL